MRIPKIEEVQAGDELFTRVRKDGIPKNTWGVVESIDDEGVWVDVYIPMDSDIPEDTVCYKPDELYFE